MGTRKQPALQRLRTVGSIAPVIVLFRGDSSNSTVMEFISEVSHPMKEINQLSARQDGFRAPSLLWVPADLSIPLARDPFLEQRIVLLQLSLNCGDNHAGRAQTRAGVSGTVLSDSRGLLVRIDGPSDYIKDRLRDLPEEMAEEQLGFRDLR